MLTAGEVAQVKEKRHFLELSDDIERKLKASADAGPLVYLLKASRDRARNAMQKLVYVDSANAAEIHKLQLDALVFQLYVEDLRFVLQRADEIADAITQEDRDEIERMIRDGEADVLSVSLGPPD